MLDITCPYCATTYSTEINGKEPNTELTNEKCNSCGRFFAFEYELKALLLHTRELKPAIFELSVGDLVIRKGAHEAKVYFVEAIDEDGVLLVNGINDELYSNDKAGIQDNSLDYFYDNFRLLAKKENLETD
ncbi:hypothetical protein A5882_003488 [Enterococcus sp. 4E1_DIV0656]|uniref:hypothetical protein n=1 Tax=Enterococcus sp. 4E1_DIV0656 TaxID=1834180 RepID=UPI000A3701EC|nr:hypothetical protein [Enterococcus sp. 4E1_DIV0656]OTO09158.1 hypothetical protein A5882_003488 [Enterococcus sp. 4E1_DIV0656]